jgi:hypothetical protein
MTMKYYLSVITFAIFVVFTCGNNALGAVNVRGSIARTEVITDASGVESTTETTNYNYSLSFQKALTRTISLNGDIRWTNTVIDKDGEVTKTKSAFPVFTLSYRPPAQYNIRFGFNRTDSSPSQGDRVTTENMYTGFSLPSSRLPSLNINYNRSTTEDAGDVQQLNTVSSVINVSTAHGFKYRDASVRINYALGLSSLEDNVGDTTTETSSHLVTTSVNRRFLDDKLKLGMNFGLDLKETTSESQGSPSRFEQSVGATSGLESEAPADPSSVVLVNESQLIDNDRSTAVTPSTDPAIDLSKDDWNIGLGFSGTKDIHSLNLYITTALSEATISAYNFAWRVYSSDNNVTWTLVAGVSGTYNSVFSRFEFDFTEKTARYFKVVNTSSPPVLGDIEVTEIEAIGYALSTPTNSYTTSTTRNFSGLTLTYAPTRRLRLGMSFNLDSTQTESDGSDSTELKNTRYGMNGRYAVIPKYLTFASTYSSLMSTPSDSDESETNSYRLAFSLTPLDTVNASVSYLYSEALLDGTVQSEQSSINTNVFMALYTGIDLNMGVTYGTTEAPVQGTETESSSYRWGLKLKPWKPIIVLINSSNSSSESKENDGTTTSSTSKSLDMKLSYTPSRKIYMSANFDFEPEASEVYSLTWIPTRNIQCSVRYNSNEDGSGASTNLSWRPFKPISLHAGYTVSWTDNETSDQTETISVRASMRF